MTGRRGVTLLAVVALAACGGSDDTSTDATSSAGSISDDGAVTEPASTDPTPTESAITGPAATDPPATEPPPATDPSPPSELADLTGLASITITTPPAGNGERPLLAWEEVSGAAGYALTLSDPTGAPYWAWSGPSAEIWLGGTQEQPADGTSGPVLTGPLVLLVVALDGEGSIVAADAPTEIAP